MSIAIPASITAFMTTYSLAAFVFVLFSATVTSLYLDGCSLPRDLLRD